MKRAIYFSFANSNSTINIYKDIARICSTNNFFIQLFVNSSTFLFLYGIILWHVLIKHLYGKMILLHQLMSPFVQTLAHYLDERITCPTVYNVLLKSSQFNFYYV